MLVLDRSAECRFAVGIPEEVNLWKKSVQRERAYGHFLLLALCLDVRNLLFDTVAVIG
jgi:hypothetical protein